MGMALLGLSCMHTAQQLSRWMTHTAGGWPEMGMAYPEKFR